MKITKYGSATVKIESNGISILCDPWLTDGIYYGAWSNYPPIDLDEIDFSSIDYVYVSHVHPDHFDPKTMDLIDKNTPVLIHKYHMKYLKANIERLGFTVIELDNGSPFLLGNDVNISIFAADNCDPKICGRMFGCVNKEIKGSMQLDSLCVIDDGHYVLVNTNDCPYQISKNTLVQVKSNYPKIDFALVGYTSASLYPHCMIDYSDTQMKAGRNRAKLRGLETGLNTVKALNPEYYMPFAGTYILGGKYSKKNSNLPIPEIQDAVKYIQEHLKKESIGSKPILLNFKEHFDLSTKNQSSPYKIINPEERNQYISEVASQFRYKFEDEPIPDNAELIDLFSQSCVRLKRKQKDVNLYEDLDIVFDVNEGQFVKINLMNTDLSLVNNIDQLQNYHRFRMDPRLLNLALKGPRYANWNNIEIGALLDFARKPDVYRMDVHTLINALHV